MSSSPSFTSRLAKARMYCPPSRDENSVFGSQLWFAIAISGNIPHAALELNAIALEQ